MILSINLKYQVCDMKFVFQLKAQNNSAIVQ